MHGVSHQKVRKSLCSAKLYVCTAQSEMSAIHVFRIWIQIWSQGAFNNVKTIERIAKLMIQILIKSFDYIYNTGLVLVLYSANDASMSSIPGLSRTSGHWADYVLFSKVIYCIFFSADFTSNFNELFILDHFKIIFFLIIKHFI